ncbi:MAG: NAD-dependent epimerase/dehydratase family protein [Planctomycetota bacterium]|nr:NAD-dependent epimerase/dehydratase family protein [Planctomycetota bacterium]
MRALVTGGHGFVGSHLVEQLLAAGHAVRCLYRRPGEPASLAHLDVEIARGDVRDAAAVRAALEGVDSVFHLAALTRSLTRRQMLATNTAGTRTLMEAALAADLPGRFVFCSSLAAVGPAPTGVPHDEHAPRRPITWYGESKRVAEDLLLSVADRLAVTILRPPAVYGPRDRDFLSMFRAAKSGWIPIVGGLDRRYSLIHGHDLGAGLLAAGTAEATRGKAYFVTHPAVITQGEMIAAAEAAVGRTARRLRLPESLMRMLGTLTDLGCQLTGRPSLLGSQRMRELATEHWVCSSAALERDAGWRAAIDLEAGFAETVAWYREQGRL